MFISFFLYIIRNLVAHVPNFFRYLVYRQNTLTNGITTSGPVTIITGTTIAQEQDGESRLPDLHLGWVVVAVMRKLEWRRHISSCLSYTDLTICAERALVLVPPPKTSETHTTTRLDRTSRLFLELKDGAVHFPHSRVYEEDNGGVYTRTSSPLGCVLEFFMLVVSRVSLVTTTKETGCKRKKGKRGALRTFMNEERPVTYPYSNSYITSAGSTSTKSKRGVKRKTTAREDIAAPVAKDSTTQDNDSPEQQQGERLSARIRTRRINNREMDGGVCCGLHHTASGVALWRRSMKYILCKWQQLTQVSFSFVAHVSSQSKGKKARIGRLAPKNY